MRWIKAAWTWIVGQSIEHWPEILAAIVGFGGMTYLASISQVLNQYGPVAWAATGLVSALIIVAVSWTVASTRMKLIEVRFAKKRSEAIDVNPLNDRFENQRIKLSDFFHPFHSPNTNKRFDHCELFGPAHVYTSGGLFNECIFHFCETVIVKVNTPVVGVTVFHECVFDRCNIFKVTFFMTKTQYAQMFSQHKGTPFLPVISDGTSNL